MSLIPTGDNKLLQEQMCGLCFVQFVDILWICLLHLYVLERNIVLLLFVAFIANKKSLFDKKFSP